MSALLPNIKKNLRKGQSNHALRVQFNQKWRQGQQEQQQHTQKLQALKKNIELQQASLIQNEQYKRKKPKKKNSYWTSKINHSRAQRSSKILMKRRRYF